MANGDRVLHIPFNQGQDEGYDEKLLPNGTFRQVFNMQLERNGRMARRQRLLKRPGVAGKSFSDYEPIEFSEPSGFIGEDKNGRRAAFDWSYEDGDTVTKQKGGFLPECDDVELLYSGQDPGNGGSQRQPQVAIDSDGHIILAYMQGSAESSESSEEAVIEIREQESFALIKRLTYDLTNGVANSTTNSLKLVASTQTNRAALVFNVNGSGVANKELRAITFGTVSPYLFASNFTAIVNNASDMPGAFDAAELPDRDAFLVACRDGSASPASGTAFLFEMDFSATGTTTLDQFSITIGTKSARFGCHASDKRWMWGMCDVSFDNPTTVGETKLRTLPWSGGIVDEFIEVANRPRTPPMFMTSSTETCVIWGVMSSSVFPGRVKGRYLLWDHSNNTFSVSINIESAYPVCAPVVYEKAGSDEGVFHFASEEAYYSALDTDGNAGTSGEAAPVFEPGGGVHTLAMTNENIAALTKISPVTARVLRAGMRKFKATADYPFDATSPPHPVRYSRDGSEYCIYPLEIEKFVEGQSSGNSGVVDGARSAVWGVTRKGSKGGLVGQGKVTRPGETLFPGGTIYSSDQVQTIAPYMGPPHVENLIVNASGGSLGAGDYILSFVLEYEDANGRLWQSAPSVPRTITSTTNDTITVYISVPPGSGGGCKGSKLVAYITNLDGSILRRRFHIGMASGQRTSAFLINSIGTASASAEIIYTAGGVPANNAPPACKFLARTRNRVWAGGLSQKNRIQASKVLNEGLGVHWSDLDSFSVYLPGEVTGVAAMDDGVIAFTRNAVFAIHGAGPTTTALGSFTTPQVIPSTVGCISPKSVVSDENGVYFQSERGLEFISRGFSSPKWIGQPVRDTLESFPFCRGSAVSPQDWTVRWLFVNDEFNPTDSRVVVWDARARSWYVHDYNVNDGVFEIIGENTGRDATDRTARSIFLGEIGDASELYVEDRTKGFEALAGDTSFIETGSIRVAGVQAWGFGRRVNLLGQFGGRDCNVTLEFAFDDTDYLDSDTSTWALSAADRGSDVPVELELTLPVQQFSSVQFRVRVTTALSSTTDTFTFKPNALSIYYTPTPEGPRVSSRDKG